jgi:hypothetical protein
MRRNQVFWGKGCGDWSDSAARSITSDTRLSTRSAKSK